MIDQLLIYQEKDAELRKIELELYNSEDRKNGVIAKKYIEGATDNINTLDLRAAKLNAEYERTLEEQAKLKEQESEIEKAVKDVADEQGANYLSKKIEEYSAKIKAIESKIAQIGSEIQAVIKEYSNIKNTIKSMQVQMSECGEKYKALKDSVADKKASIEKELEEIKKNVDPVLMDKYLKKRANKMYPIAFPVKNNVCGACNMELSMSVMNKLKNGEVVECDNCGRLLYLK